MADRESVIIFLLFTSNILTIEFISVKKGQLKLLLVALLFKNYQTKLHLVFLYT
jgi:hypothetical protein